MILFFTTDERAGSLAHRVLSSAALTVRSCSDWDVFRRALGSGCAAVIVAPWLDDGICMTELQRFASVQPWYPVVVVTDDAPTNLRLLARVVVFEVVFLQEISRLPEILARATRNGVFQRVAHQVRTVKRIPPLLRHALVHSLHHEAPAEPVDPTDPRAPTRSIRALATRIGASEDALSRAAARCGLNLRKHLDWCISLRALQIRATPGITWEQIAWRLGFASGSGLSEHLRRTLGARPTEIDRADVGQYFARFEREIHAWLVEPGTEILKLERIP